MGLIPTQEIMAAAYARGRGVGAFNVIQLEHAEALVAGATLAGAPVILQISENAVAYHGALAPVGLATLAVARTAEVPVAVHLDHATRASLVREAISLGFGSVMFDGSSLPYEKNVEATAGVVAECHAAGLVVEAELGEVGGKDGVHAPGVRTDPDQANAFVRATGVDALAVAVGTSHAMTSKDASIDLDLIARHRATVDVPLVLHGSSGVPDEQLTAAVHAGMTKINIATSLNVAFTEAVRAYLSAEPAVVDTRKYLAAGRRAVTEEVRRLLAEVLFAGG
jgi:fructose-bisphosphate aldolase, class II